MASLSPRHVRWSFYPIRSQDADRRDKARLLASLRFVVKKRVRTTWTIDQVERTAAGCLRIAATTYECPDGQSNPDSSEDRGDERSRANCGVD
jgi:hypothetical protein